MSMRTDRWDAARFQIIAFIAVIIVGDLITPLQILHDWPFAVKYRYDFALFDYAFHVVWHGQPAALLYNTTAQHRWLVGLHYPIYRHQQYVYPPQFAVLLSWLGALPFRLAAGIWDGAAVLSWICTAFLSIRLAYRGRSRLPVVLLMLIAISFVPFWTDAIVANSNWLVAVLVATAMYATYGPRKRPLLAGVALGLAMVFKVTPTVILLIWLTRKYWQAAAYTLVTVIVSTTITVAVLGVAAIGDYVDRFRQLTASSMQNGPAPYNSSFKGVLSLWQSPHGPLTATHIAIAFDAYLIVAVALLALSLRKWAGGDGRREAAIVSLTPLLLSPLLELPQMMTVFISLAVLIGLWWEDLNDRGVATTRHGQGRLARFFTFTLVSLAFCSPILAVAGTSLHVPIAYFVGIMGLFTLIECL